VGARKTAASDIPPELSQITNGSAQLDQLRGLVRRLGSVMGWLFGIADWLNAAEDGPVSPATGSTTTVRQRDAKASSTRSWRDHPSYDDAIQASEVLQEVRDRLECEGRSY
jgi:hypothetical protein